MLRMERFATGIRPLTRASFANIERVVMCVRHEWERQEILDVVDQLDAPE